MKSVALSLASLWALLWLCSMSMVQASSSTSDTEELEFVEPDIDWNSISFYARPLGTDVPFLLLTDDFNKSFAQDPRYSFADHFKRVCDVELLFLNGRAAPKPELILKKMVKSGETFSMVAPLNLETFLIDQVAENITNRFEIAGALVTITSSKFTCQMLSLPGSIKVIDIKTNLNSADAILDDLEAFLSLPAHEEQPENDILIPFGQNLASENKFGFLAKGIAERDREIRIKCAEQFSVVLMFPGLFVGRCHVKVYETATGNEIERSKTAAYMDISHGTKHHHMLKSLYNCILDGSLQEHVRLKISAIFFDGFFLDSTKTCSIGIQFERRLNHVEAAVLHEFLFGKIGYFSKMDEIHCNAGCLGQGCCSVPGVRSLTIDFQKRNFFLRHSKPVNCKGLEKTSFDLPLLIGDETRHAKITEAVKTHRRRNNKIKAMMLGPLFPMQTNPVIISTTCPASKAHMLIAEIGSKVIFDPSDPVALRDTVDSVFYLNTSENEAFVGVTVKARSLIALNNIRDALNGLILTNKPSKPFELNTSVVVHIEENGWITVTNAFKAPSNAPKKLTNKDIKVALKNIAPTSTKPSLPAPTKTKEASVMKQETPKKEVVTEKKKEVVPTKTATPVKVVTANPDVSKKSQKQPRDVSSEMIVPKSMVLEAVERASGDIEVKSIEVIADPVPEAQQLGIKFADSENKQTSLYVQCPGIKKPAFLTDDAKKALFGKTPCLSIPSRILDGTGLPGHVVTIIQTPLLEAGSLETLDLEQSEYNLIGQDFLEYDEMVIVNTLKDYIELVSEGLFVRMVFTPPRVIVQRCKLVRAVMSTDEPGYIAALPAENPDLPIRLPRISMSSEFCAVVAWLRTSVIWYNMSLADEGVAPGNPVIFRFFNQKAEFNADALLLLIFTGDSLKQYISSIRVYYSTVVPGVLTVEICGTPTFMSASPSSLRKILPRVGDKQTHMVTLGLATPAGTKRTKANAENGTALLSDDFPSFTVQNLNASVIKPSRVTSTMDLKNTFNQCKGKGSKGILIQRQAMPKNAEKHKTKFYTVNMEERHLNQRFPLIATSLLNTDVEDDSVPMWIFALHSIHISPTSAAGKVKKSPMWKIKVEFFEDRICQFNFAEVTKELGLLFNDGKSCRLVASPVEDKVKTEVTIAASTTVEVLTFGLPLPVEEVLLPESPSAIEPATEPVEELLTIALFPEFALPEEAAEVAFEEPAVASQANVVELIHMELAEEIDAVSSQLSVEDIVLEIQAAAESLFEETAFLTFGSSPMMPIEGFTSFMTLLDTLSLDNDEALRIYRKSSVVESLAPKAGSGRQTLKKSILSGLALPGFIALVKQFFMESELTSFVLAVECGYESGRASLSLTCDIPHDSHFSTNMRMIVTAWNKSFQL